MNTARLELFAVVIAFVAGLAAPVRAQTHDGYHLPPGWMPPVHDRIINYLVLFEKLELRAGEAKDAAVVDAQGWIGGDYHRFWWKAEGEHDLSSPKSGDIAVQALYGRLFSPYWDFQAGVKLDRHYSGPHPDTRTHLALGVQGTAPYWFELEPTFFLSDKGEVTFALEASYEQLITQHWVLEPRVDLRAAFRDDPDRRVGSGINDVEVGLRLRYEINRQFAPYAGLTWRRSVGQTGRWRALDGQPKSEGAVVVGLRTWF